MCLCISAYATFAICYPLSMYMYAICLLITFSWDVLEHVRNYYSSDRSHWFTQTPSLLSHHIN